MTWVESEEELIWPGTIIFILVGIVDEMSTKCHDILGLLLIFQKLCVGF